MPMHLVWSGVEGATNTRITSSPRSGAQAAASAHFEIHCFVEVTAACGSLLAKALKATRHHSTRARLSCVLLPFASRPAMASRDPNQRLPLQQLTADCMYSSMPMLSWCMWHRFRRLDHGLEEQCA